MFVWLCPVNQLCPVLSISDNITFVPAPHLNWMSDYLLSPLSLRFTCRDLANFSWSAANLGIKPNPAQMRALYSAASDLRMARTSDPSAVAGLLYALSRWKTHAIPVPETFLLSLWQTSASAQSLNRWVLCMANTTGGWYNCDPFVHGGSSQWSKLNICFINRYFKKKNDLGFLLRTRFSAAQLSDVVRSLAKLSIRPPLSWSLSFSSRLKVALEEESGHGRKKNSGQHLSPRVKMLMFKAMRKLGLGEIEVI